MFKNRESLESTDWRVIWAVDELPTSAVYPTKTVIWILSLIEGRVKLDEASDHKENLRVDWRARIILPNGHKLDGT